jgi:hypothetical protein
MATLTRQKVIQSGLTPSYASAGGSGDVVDNSDGRTFLHVKNDGGGSINVTVTAQVSSLATAGHGTLTVSNNVVAVPAGQNRMIGPFPKQAFNNASKQLAISYSGTTSVTIAALYIEA